MADNLKIWRNNKWFGGYSEDPHIGIDGSFWRGAGVEVRRFPRILQLSKAISNQAGAVITVALKGCVVTSNFGDTIAVGDSGKVYRRAKGASTWALVYTDTGSDHIVSIVEYNGYLYWATKNKIHRIIIGDTGTDTTWTTVTEDYKSLNNSVFTHPMFEAFNKLYVGDGDEVAQLDSSAVWTNTKLQFASDDEVRRITFTGNMIRFWCRKAVNGSSQFERDEGTCYLWNGVSDSYTESVKLDGMFQTCATMEGMDYFIAGQTPALYVMNGVTPQRLKTIPFLTNPSANDLTTMRVRFWDNAMCAARGMLYFGSPTGISTNYIENGVWSYGRLNTAFPLSLNLDYPITGDAPSLVANTDGVITIGVTNGATKYCYAEDWAKYQTTGELETRVFDGGGSWQIKDSVKLALGFYQLASGEKIEVYVKTNLGASYGSVILSADYATVADRGVTYKYLTLPWTGKEFNHLQIKVKLTAGTSQGTTPKLCDLALLYEEIKQP